MEKIKDTILNIMQTWEAQERQAPAQDLDLWLKKILTKKELKHIKIDYFRKGIVGISVDSSPWLYSLTLRKGDILARLRHYSDNVKDIRLRIGETS
jgi:hypothetical protein